jgi:hypothetical protein
VFQDRSLRVLHGKGGKARITPLPSDAAEAVDRDCLKRFRLTSPQWLGTAFVVPPDVHEVARRCAGVVVL